MASSIHQLIDREARKWEQNRLRRPPRQSGPWSGPPVICVSREYGAAGGTFARALGERLGFEVYDRKLLEALGREAHIRDKVLESVDEQTRGWFHDLMRDMFSGDATAHWRYEEHLAQILMTLAHHGNSILVGRGANFLIPRHASLSVRVVADREWRLERIARLQDIPTIEAGEQVDANDRLRNSFIRTSFGHDPADAHGYDLVLNSVTLPLEAQVATAETAFRAKFPTARVPDPGEVLRLRTTANT